MVHKTIRKIIEIDRDKCDGCGLCVSACHEGAIGIVHGKAMLLSDTYCDGFIAYNDTQSCIKWCAYAKGCVGDEVYERFMGRSRQ